MTASEWLACTDPTPMLAFLRGRASERKLRLFAVACCRRLRSLMRAKQAQNVLEVAERFAERTATVEELKEARRWIDALDPQVMRMHRAAFAWATAPEGSVHRLAVGTARYAADYHNRPENEKTAQCRLIRDIFGNPFRPVAIDPTWLTWDDGNVPRMASAIYNERAIDRMPSLTDALEDAGCDDQAILQHCRSRSDHVRGCWVLDVLLGRS